MNDPLVLCDACSRHVKASETSCPFCGASTNSARPSAGEPFRRMAAAAAVAAGVVGLSGCSSSGMVFYGSAGIIVDAGDRSTEDSPSVVVFYGSPNPLPGDAGADVPVDAPFDAPEDGSG
jgi:hypothetical protein